MSVAMYKMVTGEVVIGRVEDESITEDQITIERPLLLMLDPAQGGVGMIPYDAIYTQEEIKEFTFDTKNIIHEMKVHPSFEEAYVKQTTKIETPDQKIIT